MKYRILIVVAIALCMLANPVYAWPEPKDYSGVVEWNGQPHSPFDSGRWSSQAKYCFRIGEDVPPQLDLIQASKWRVTWPINRALLAERYGVPQDIAKQYGAVYLELLGLHDIKGISQLEEGEKEIESPPQLNITQVLEILQNNMWQLY